jgi:hypothetical protein
MLDSELGYHPQHPNVVAGKVKSSRGWDGEYGPFIETINKRQFVNAASLDRSDYVTNAMNGYISVRKTAAADGSELIRRMDALRRAIAVLAPLSDRVSKTKLWLVSADSVADWEHDPDRADSRLTGRGLKYLFVKYDAEPILTSDPTRVRFRIRARLECQISDARMVARKIGRNWKFVDLPRLETPASA